MRRFLMLMLGVLLLSSQLLAQSRTVTGRVTDANGAPIAGASVQVKGTNAGTVTKTDGTYSINVPGNSRTLTISALGQTAQDVAINGQATVNVSLNASSERSLQEVVVVGYGTQRRRDLTGSVASVKAADIENKPFSSVDKALQGQVPGLQSVAGSGAPGANQQILIRGISSINASNSPLWVVDGVILNTGDVSRLTTTANLLSTLNPNDLESITVLKDAASTSIYGSRGANGVILVTTKRGRAGKTKFRFDAEAGSSDIAYKNPKYRSLTASEYLMITGEGLGNAGYDQATIDATLKALGKGNGTDFNWLNALTQKGTQQQYNLSASGGTDKSTFYMSGGYFKQGGVSIKTDLERYNGAIRLTNQATDRLSLNMNLDGGFVRQHTPLAGGAFGNPILSSYFILPTLSAYKADGSYNILTPDFPTSSTYNTVALANMDKRYLKQFSLRGSVGAEYKILNNLRFNTNFGTDYNTLEEDQYNNPFYGDGAVLAPNSPTSGPNIQYNFTSTGRAYDYYTRYFNWTWTNTLNYRQNFSANGDFYGNIKVGYESQQSRGYLTGLQNTGFPLTMLLQYPASAATPKTATAQITDYSFLSQFAIADFNYHDRFILSGSYRRDGSSRFSPDHKYGSFWSVGGSWNVDREEFMRDIGFVSQLKLRASYGVNGNAGIGNYDYFQTYGFGFNYNSAPGSAPSNVGNPNLTWELNKPLDVGLDVTVLKNRLGITADYYNRKSEDLLLDVQLSRTSGFLSQRKNAGSMSNKGFELGINGTPVQFKDFTWNVNFNFAANKNKVTSLPDGKDISNGSFLYRVGYDVQSFYVRQYAGVDPANGDPLWYTDSTGKSTTNNYSGAKRFLYGSASPKYFGGFTNTFRYKGFTLEAQLYYNFGNYVQDSWGAYYVGAGFGATFNKVARVLDRWTTPNQVTDIPKYVYGGNKSFQSFSTFYLNQGDFIRLRDLRLGYDLPKSIVSKAKISTASIYVRGSNLWTWVKDKNLPFDPEQGSASQTNLNVFIPKTITVGVNLGF